MLVIRRSLLDQTSSPIPQIVPLEGQQHQMEAGTFLILSSGTGVQKLTVSECEGSL